MAVHGMELRYIFPTLWFAEFVCAQSTICLSAGWSKAANGSVITVTVIANSLCDARKIQHMQHVTTTSYLHFCAQVVAILATCAPYMLLLVRRCIAALHVALELALPVKAA